MAHAAVIATIGPVSNSPEKLIALHRAGMTVARLNGSHGSLEWHQGVIEVIRRTLPELPILLDIPGRKIRTTQLKTEPSFAVGDRLTLTTDLSYDGQLKVPVNYDQFHLRLRSGTRIYADDGTLSFIVEKIQDRDVVVIAETSGTLKSRKGINVPEINLGQQLVTPRDHEMIAFAKRAGVDFVGISFVESATHVEAIRDLIGLPTPKIVAKVENQGGLDHLDEIAASADVIMIDRGDLSVETSVDHVSIHQKRIIAAANVHGKPVIVATELLHSMIESPLPTKAEISDITNAVIDGASAVMLSGETAIGKFPIEAVSRLKSIVSLAETHRRSTTPLFFDKIIEQGDLRVATRALAHALPITKVVVLSKTGYAARLIAMAQLQQPIIAIGSNAELARTWNLLPGTTGVVCSLGSDMYAEGVDIVVLEHLWRQGHVSHEDIVLLVLVTRDDEQASLNSLQTVRVGQLANRLAWSIAKPVDIEV